MLRSSFRYISLAVGISLMCLSVISAPAQNIGKIRKDYSYICSEASEKTAEKADSAALSGLSDKIAEIAGFSGMQTGHKREIMRSYLSEIEKSSEIIYREKTTAFRYIRRDAVSSLFDGRKAKVNEMLSIADKAAGSRQIDVALRYWNWASTLLKSIPPLDEKTITSTEKKKDKLLDGLHVKYSTPDRYAGDVIELDFSSDGQPVQSVDYSFFDGKKWSGILSAKDGKGFARISSASPVSEYRVRYEIRAEHLQHIYRDIKQLDAIFKVPEKPVQNAACGTQSEAPHNTVQKIDFSDVKRKILDVIASQERKDVDSLVLELSPVAGSAEYEAIIENICNAINDRATDGIDSLFTSEGLDIFHKLISYGNARVLNRPAPLFYSLGENIYARNIPMVFSFPRNDREFVENVVFTFDKDGKISDVSFALARKSAEDIASHTNWPEEARIILMNFLESYKTAYALKRLDYISSIFDEDALIITGRVLKPAGKVNEFGAGKYVSFTRQSKSEYIKRLSNVFRSQEFINIQFTGCDVTKLGKAPGLYGIKLRQEYFSSSYSDTGYLFILVDLHNPDTPVIHVRTWQEEPDKNFGIIGPYDF